MNILFNTFINIISLSCLVCSTLYAQTDSTKLRVVETKNEIRFITTTMPIKILCKLSKQDIFLSLAETKVVKSWQYLGSAKLTWRTKKETHYYVEKYDSINHCILVQYENKRDTVFITYSLEEKEHKLLFTYQTVKNRKERKNLSIYTRVTFHIPLEVGEEVFGGGEQFSFVNTKGRVIPYLVEEQGIGRGDRPISILTALRGAAGNSTTTFMPMTRFITSKKRRFTNVPDSYTYKKIDFTKPNFIQWKDYTNASSSSVVLYKSRNEAWNIVQTISPQPAFIFKTILGLQGGTDTVLHKLKILTDAGVKPAAIWIQDWCGRRVTPFGKQLVWNWELDTLRYPRFTTFRDSLKAKNIKLLGYINPFLAKNTRLANEAQKIDSISSKFKHSILLQDPKKHTAYTTRATGFDVCTFNLNTDNTYLYNVIKNNLLRHEFSGWMADFGEWYPFSETTKKKVRYGKNKQNAAISLHNEYPVKWATLQELIKQDFIKEKQDTLGIFMRSATTATGQLAWAGDQNTTWGQADGLPSLIPALLSSGLSGTAINHGDIGGFTSFKRKSFKMIRHRELLYRWIEIAAFTPVFRTHEGLAPDFNIQVYSDTAAARFFATFSAIHNNLFPYLIETYKEISTKNLPMIRHLIINYPNDTNVAIIDKEFMLGSDILVIPVLKQGATEVKGYLPSGVWQHYFTKQVINSSGEWYDFNAPIGRPCVWKLLEKIK